MTPNLTHDPAECPNCVAHTSGPTSDVLPVAVAYKMCREGRAATDRKYAEARAANPEIAAIHRMLGIAR